MEENPRYRTDEAGTTEVSQIHRRSLTLGQSAARILVGVYLFEMSAITPVETLTYIDDVASFAFMTSGVINILRHFYNHFIGSRGTDN